MDIILPTADTSACPQCGSQVAPSLLACPACGGLIFAERLKHLADQAAAATNAGDPSTSLAHWREAMDLLPPDSRQYAIVRDRVGALSKQVDSFLPPAAVRDAPRPAVRQDSTLTTRPDDSSSTAEKNTGATKSRGLIGAAAMGLMFVVTKGKLLLLGLTKAGTFFSMLASVGVYWTAFGWKFALGLVVSIYIHEMGHVAMLQRFGIKASAPMFIPGLGAIVRLKQHLPSPAVDARVGLAGPMWGLGAAFGAYAVSFAAGWPSWAAIGHIGAYINLFNLLPVWQLDGGRAFNAMSRPLRAVAIVAPLAAFVVTQEGLLVIIAIFAAGRAFSRNAPPQGDRRALVEYVFLIAALSALLMLPAPELP